jgi:hypothetical protein
MQKESRYHSVQNRLHENENDLSEINEADPTRSCGEYSLLEFLVRGSHSTDSTKKKKKQVIIPFFSMFGIAVVVMVVV